MATAGSPEIQRELATSYAGLGVVILLVPGLLGLVLEPPLFLLADRWPRKRLIVGGLIAMAVCAIAAAIAPGPITLSLAIAFGGVASGASIGLGLATMIDARPDQRARTMTRWTLMGLIGDALAPAVLAGFAAIGWSWRQEYVAIAVVLVVWAIAIAARPLPAAPVAATDDDVAAPTPGLWATLVATLRNRKLLVWLVALLLVELMDEILVVLSSLHLRDDLGAGVAWRTIVISAFVAGGAIGLVVLERLLARGVAVLRLLVGASIACAIVYVAWLAAPTPLTCALMMPLVGATAAPLYPLASAQAYAVHPGGSGALLAANHLFTPVALALPWVLGVIADHWGVPVALAVLVVEPIGLAILASRG